MSDDKVALSRQDRVDDDSKKEHCNKKAKRLQSNFGGLFQLSSESKRRKPEAKEPEEEPADLAKDEGEMDPVRRQREMEEMMQYIREEDDAIAARDPVYAALLKKTRDEAKKDELSGVPEKSSTESSSSIVSTTREEVQ